MQIHVSHSTIISTIPAPIHPDQPIIILTFQNCDTYHRHNIVPTAFAADICMKKPSKQRRELQRGSFKIFRIKDESMRSTWNSAVIIEITAYFTFEKSFLHVHRLSQIHCFQYNILNYMRDSNELLRSQAKKNLILANIHQAFWFSIERYVWHRQKDSQ